MNKTTNLGINGTTCTKCGEKNCNFSGSQTHKCSEPVTKKTPTLKELKSEFEKLGPEGAMKNPALKELFEKYRDTQHKEWIKTNKPTTFKEENISAVAGLLVIIIVFLLGDMFGHWQATNLRYPTWHTPKGCPVYVGGVR